MNKRKKIVLDVDKTKKRMSRFVWDCKGVTCQLIQLYKHLGWITRTKSISYRHFNISIWIQSEVYSEHLNPHTHPSSFQLNFQVFLCRLFSRHTFLGVIFFFRINISSYSSNYALAHYSFSRSKYFHLLLAPIKGFISLIG